MNTLNILKHIIDDIDALTRERDEARAIIERLHTPRLLNDWHGDMGNVLWFHYPICEPPFCGEPHDLNWPFDEKDQSVYWVPLPDLQVVNQRCKVAEDAKRAWIDYTTQDVLRERLEESVKTIEAKLERLEKARRVTRETLDLEFTV